MTVIANSWEIYYSWQEVGKHILCVRFLVFKMRTSQSNKGSKVKNFNLQSYIGFCNISGKHWQVYSLIINMIRKLTKNGCEMLVSIILRF